jgi:hypothetical protein
MLRIEGSIRFPDGIHEVEQLPQAVSQGDVAPFAGRPLAAV